MAIAGLPRQEGWGDDDMVMINAGQSREAGVKGKRDFAAIDNPNVGREKRIQPSREMRPFHLGLGVEMCGLASSVNS